MVIRLSRYLLTISLLVAVCMGSKLALYITVILVTIAIEFITEWMKKRHYSGGTIDTGDRIMEKAMCEEKPCAATPPEDLTERLMSASVPKSELEWYAKRKEELEAENSKLKADRDEWRNKCVTAEVDANYYHAIFDGSWPTAIETLKATLKTLEVNNANG